MHRWQVGEVEIVRVEDADFALPAATPVPDWCVPAFAPSPDEYRIAFSALAIADGATRIVVDPWLQSGRDQPGAAEHADRLLAELDDAGFPPAEVDVVVNSHLEGVGWCTRPGGDGWALSFPRAQYLYPAAEAAAAESGVDLDGRDDFVHLTTLTHVERVDGTRALTPSVRVEPGPGHSVGHQVVRVESGGDLAMYLGHLVIEPQQLVDPGPHVTDTAGAGAPATRRRLLDELADRNGLLLTTLIGGPGGGRVHRAGEGYRVEVA